MPSGYDKIDALTPEQGSFLQQLMQMLGGMGMQGGQAGIQHYLDILSNKPGAFEAFEAPMKRQFNEQVMPGIAEQFAGVGGLSSSAFPQQMAQAGKGLSENLASMRAGLQGQAAQGLMGGLQGLGGLGLGTKAFGFAPKQSGMFGNLFGGMGGGLGQGMGMMGGGGIMQLLQRLMGGGQ